MTRLLRHAAGAAVLAAWFLMAVPALAMAEEASLSVAAPGQVDVGATVQVQATLTAGGNPVAGAPLELQYRGGFGGVTGFVVLDAAVTGPDGAATFEYQQRAADNGDMRVLYVGDDQALSVAPATFTIEVSEGGTQLHRSRAGVSIPFLNSTVVIGIIMLVWAVIVYAAFQLVNIGRMGAERRGVRPWVARLLAGIATVTAIGMVVVFARTPLTHANLDTPEGYNRTPVAYVEESLPFRSVGLANPDLADSGGAVWVGAGCASCHGLDAAGGAVGPSLHDLGSFSDFVDDVRRGPEGMPGYGPDVLSDDDLQRVYDWITSR